KLTAKPVDSHRKGGLARIQKPIECEAIARHGPGRTGVPRIRNPVLYPSELRGRTKKFRAFSTESNRSLGDCAEFCALSPAASRAESSISPFARPKMAASLAWIRM